MLFEVDSASSQALSGRGVGGGSKEVPRCQSCCRSEPRCVSPSSLLRVKGCNCLSEHPKPCKQREALMSTHLGPRPPGGRESWAWEAGSVRTRLRSSAFHLPSGQEPSFLELNQRLCRHPERKSQENGPWPGAPERMVFASEKGSHWGTNDGVHNQITSGN